MKWFLPAHAITSQMQSYVNSSCSWALCGRVAHSVLCSGLSRCYETRVCAQERSEIWITKNSYPLATVRILLGAARYRVDQFASLFPCSSMRGPRKDDAQSRVFTPTRTGRYAALRRTGTGASSTTVCAH